MTPEARLRRRIRTPVLVVTAIAWAATLAVHAFPSGSGHDMAGMAGMAPAPQPQPASVLERHPLDDSSGSLSAFLTGWPLMLTAMMAPLLIPALRHVYARSLPSRRWRALTLLTAVYAVTWSVAGLILQAVATAVQAAVRPAGVAIAFAVFPAVVWQLSPLKQRCLNRRHAHPPLAAFGRAADVGVLRFGCMHALWCLGSCWALMLFPLVFDGWHLAVMAIVTLWIWAELFDTPVVPTWRIRMPVKAARIVAAIGADRATVQGSARVG